MCIVVANLDYTDTKLYSLCQECYWTEISYCYNEKSAYIVQPYLLVINHLRTYLIQYIM